MKTFLRLLIETIVLAQKGFILVYIPGIINFLAGPLPKFVCYGITFMRHALFYHLIFFFDTISIMKYDKEYFLLIFQNNTTIVSKLFGR